MLNPEGFKMSKNRAKSASKYIDWEITPFRCMDLGYWSERISTKTAKLLGYERKAAVQVWDEATSNWSIPWCDVTKRQAQLIVKRWTHDLICTNQLPLWAVEQYKLAALEEGETYLKRYRHIFVSIREYDNLNDVFLPKTQEIIYSVLFVPSVTDAGVMWRALRLLQPNVSPREAIGDYLNNDSSRYLELSWAAKKLPWELKTPKRTSERLLFDQVR